MWLNICFPNLHKEERRRGGEEERRRGGEEERRRGGERDAYIELLPEELAVVRRAEPVLVLQVLHQDGEEGLGGWGGSRQKDHRLLLCWVENNQFIIPAALIMLNVVMVNYLLR